MYDYNWDPESGGLILKNTPPKLSKEPRPVWSRELDLLGFERFFDYPKTDETPIMWAEGPVYVYRGRRIARRIGGRWDCPPDLKILDRAEDLLQLKLLEQAEEPLRPVDIKGMVRKNQAFLDRFCGDLIGEIQTVCEQHKNKVNSFWVAFSGGKDSVALLDLVMRAVPRQFSAVFSDTGMELPDTYETVEKTKAWCEREGVAFYTAASHFDPGVSWRLFGPPSRRLRWCCSIHKSDPACELKRRLVGPGVQFMFTGVRAAESYARSKHGKLEANRKNGGEIMFKPILDWSSGMVWVYLFARNLPINQAYRKGLPRVGCFMCPHSSDYSNWLKLQLYPAKYYDYQICIMDTVVPQKLRKGELNERTAIETSLWKCRVNGEYLKCVRQKLNCGETINYFWFTFSKHPGNNWIEWYKTMGDLTKINDENYILEFRGVQRNLDILENSDGTIFFKIDKWEKNRNSIAFFSRFKKVMIKALYCVGCRHCVTVCPFQNIEMKGNAVTIKDSCVKCGACMTAIKPFGCIYYNCVREK